MGIDLKYNMDVTSNKFVRFLIWYKNVYGNIWDEEFDTAGLIIEIVANPFKFQTEYKEFIKQDEVI